MKPLRPLHTVTFIIAIHFLFTSCSFEPEHGSTEHIKKVTENVDDAYLVRADSTVGDWLSYGRNYAEDRYSRLTQINTSNVSQLGLSWWLELETTRGIETTPIVVDGIMFLTGPWSNVYAVNAGTGKMIWSYDPQVPGKFGQKACCDVVNRGLAVYKGKLFLGTLDGRLVSIDASNGKPLWEIYTVDTTKNYTITGAPRIVKGNVIIGNGGADFGVRGYVSAYDAITGKMKWRFYTVPGDPSKPYESKALAVAGESWAGEWWKYGGGGTVWDAMAFDPELNLLYIGTGNGSPWDWFHRSKGTGDNLFLSSIVALNPDNGEYVWHYQTTPGDHWDYTATQHLILADLKIDGSLKKVIMQAPKNGLFYVLDRASGKLLSAQPYTYINWASSIDKETGRPIETDFSRYKDENVEVYPGPAGGHNWQPMAYNPKTGFVYIPAHVNSMVYGHLPEWKFDTVSWNASIMPNPKAATRSDKGDVKNKDQGHLIAWDPLAQKEKWRVTHEASYWNGGVLTTAGDLVFQGTADGKFSAYDAKDGSLKWQTDLRSGIIASPVTYSIDGTQYVTIVAGWGGIIGLSNRFTDENYPGRIYTFALNANSAPPEYLKTNPKQKIDLALSVSPGEIKNGEGLYYKNCAVCHGEVDTKGGAIPGLTYSNKGTFDIFQNIVRGGMFVKKGMPDFSDRLTEKEVSDIKSFIIYSAK